ncbi:uncharacterized protein M6B38_366885 [Iris pallida]|uniref:Glycosyl transferase family 1 domain-containing protein n=1 Tax=Iris pallida TaxID=29817 RepID=A0AAX6GH05_IRIPA|nr:uncharacterized protein M6B38_366885 [Iris pallida]
MEELSGNFPRPPSSSRAPLSLKTSSMSGRSSPRSYSPSLRRLNSGRTPRRETPRPGRFQWIRNNRVVFWLILITLWAYIGFHVQSQWAHGNHVEPEFAGYTSEPRTTTAAASDSPGSNVTTTTEPLVVPRKKDLEEKLGVSVARRGQSSPPRKRRGRPDRRSTRGDVKPKEVVPPPEADVDGGSTDDGLISKKNTTYGLIVGPFGKTEESVLGWTGEKRRGTCDRKGEFARIVWSRRFVLVFHELSMTGAPLSMLELGAEMLSCGGYVSAVVLSTKGGLMSELDRRGIKVLKDKAEFSFKTAMKADIVIAGSAVCSSWIEPYLTRFPAASSQIVWWIMENRREYFDRSKSLLSMVKMLIFLSDTQSKQWLSWCEEEKIKLYTQPMIVPLSVNDELAFVAGLPSSLNTPAFSVEKMEEKRALLRSSVRKEMGLGDNDMLVMSLSSINPGKGQRLLLEAARLVAEHNISVKDTKNIELLEVEEISAVPQNHTSEIDQMRSGTLLQTNQTDKVAQYLHKNVTSRAKSRKRKKKLSRLRNILSVNHIKTVTDGEQREMRNLLSQDVSKQEETLKLLIGSIGSKSNKVLYIKSILRYISLHSNLSNMVLWTQATTHVASLYAAADVYVINAQGIGETFGRVTIEAMAFGLPVLGTDAGGTKEIVDHRVTGLLHPLGHEGTEVLAQNIQYLLKNSSARKKMGSHGRRKVLDKYLKHQTYDNFAKVLFKCMKPK